MLLLCHSVLFLEKNKKLIDQLQIWIEVAQIEENQFPDVQAWHD